MPGNKGEAARANRKPMLPQLLAEMEEIQEKGEHQLKLYVK
jgi:hypothetical protein